jgi:hypothetical protein
MATADLAQSAERRVTWPLTLSHEEITSNPAYRVVPSWIGGHGPIMIAVPFRADGSADGALPIYRQWYGNQPYYLC